ncbi:hypothetical protein JCM5296_007060 [Sporobolomyces johnsonii]
MDSHNRESTLLPAPKEVATTMGNSTEARDGAAHDALLASTLQCLASFTGKSKGQASREEGPGHEMGPYTSLDEYLENPEKLNLSDLRELAPELEEYPSWNGDPSKLSGYLREMDCLVKVYHFIPEKLLLARFGTRLSGNARRYYEMRVLGDDAPCSWEAWKQAFKRDYHGHTWRRKQQERYRLMQYRGEEPTSWLEDFIDVMEAVQPSASASEIQQAVLDIVPAQMARDLWLVFHHLGELPVSEFMQHFEEVAARHYPDGFRKKGKHVQ